VVAIAWLHMPHVTILRSHALIPQSSVAVTQLHTNCFSFYLLLRDGRQSQACLLRDRTNIDVLDFVAISIVDILNVFCSGDRTNIDVLDFVAISIVDILNVFYTDI